MLCGEKIFLGAPVDSGICPETALEIMGVKAMSVSIVSPPALNMAGEAIDRSSSSAFFLTGDEEEEEEEAACVLFGGGPQPGLRIGDVGRSRLLKADDRIEAVYRDRAYELPTSRDTIPLDMRLFCCPPPPPASAPAVAPRPLSSSAMLLTENLRPPRPPALDQDLSTLIDNPLPSVVEGLRLDAPSS